MSSTDVEVQRPSGLTPLFQLAIGKKRKQPHQPKRNKIPKAESDTSSRTVAAPALFKQASDTSSCTLTAGTVRAVNNSDATSQTMTAGAIRAGDNSDSTSHTLTAGTIDFESILSGCDKDKNDLDAVLRKAAIDNWVEEQVHQEVMREADEVISLMIEDIEESLRKDGIEPKA